MAKKTEQRGKHRLGGHAGPWEDQKQRGGGRKLGDGGHVHHLDFSDGFWDAYQIKTHRIGHFKYNLSCQLSF